MMRYRDSAARLRAFWLDVGDETWRHERIQAGVRLFLWAFVSAYFGFCRWTLDRYDFGLGEYLRFSVGFLALSLLLWFSIRHRPRFKARIYLALIGDAMAIGLAMGLSGGIFSPFFLLYPWIQISYVVRYGRPVLYAATLFSVLSYLMVLIMTTQPAGWDVAVILHLLALVVLPGYLHFLMDELVRARRSADAANQAKSRFLAHMSHEIRNPLAGVVGMAELLESGDLDARQRDRLRGLKTSAEALHALVDDVLEFSKIEAGRLELHEQTFDPRRVVEDAVGVSRPLAVKKGLYVRSDISDAVPPALWGDAHRLRQVLLNLIGNGIKFSEQGGVTVVCGVVPGRDEPVEPAARVGGADKVRLRFEVRDTGVGIPAEKLTQVFESFRQADPTVAGRFGGTGLGTTISKELVRLMGGDIGVTSRLGAGSTFWVEVPWRRATPEEVRTDGAMIAEASVLAAEATERVLVADDDPINSKVLAAFLQGAGYAVETAADGERALALLAARRYDLALVDRHMPVLDGLALVRAWRARESRGRRLPIIAVTANATAEDERECRQAGVDGFLTKPVQRRRLLDLAATLIASREPGVEEPIGPG